MYSKDQEDPEVSVKLTTERNGFQCCPLLLKELQGVLINNYNALCHLLLQCQIKCLSMKYPKKLSSAIYPKGDALLVFKRERETGWSF